MKLCIDEWNKQSTKLELPIAPFFVAFSMNFLFKMLATTQRKAAAAHLTAHYNLQPCPECNPLHSDRGFGIEICGRTIKQTDMVPLLCLSAKKDEQSQKPNEL